MSPPRLLTIGAAWRAVEALRALHDVCADIDDDNRDYRANDHAYQAAMRAAQAALRRVPNPPPTPSEGATS